jgi:hypothetical protein
MDKQMDPIPEYLALKIEGNTYLVNRNAIKLALWEKIPEGFRNPDSEEAQRPDVQTMRIGAKALLRSVLPGVLKKAFGNNAPSIPPRVDIIQWALKLLVNTSVDYIALKEWRLDVEPCQSCENGVYTVRGITTESDTANKPA